MAKTLELDAKMASYLDSLVRRDIKETKKRLQHLKAKAGQHEADVELMREHKREKIRYAEDLRKKL